LKRWITISSSIVKQLEKLWEHCAACEGWLWWLAVGALCSFLKFELSSASNRGRRAETVTSNFKTLV
jgi:hypothetical protein